MITITTADLTTNIYAETIAEITRGDETIARRAIDTAILEAKMYLVRYDLSVLFGLTEDNDNTIYDQYLVSIVKDIACWHLLKLANANTDLAVFRTAYQDALATLKAIMTGQAQPQGWPYMDTTDQMAPEGNTINWSSNPRRNNFY